MGNETGKKVMREAPEELIVEYMEHIEKQEYDAMYSMIDTEEDFYLSKEEYIERNSKIYEGIEIKSLRLNHIVTEKQEGKRVSVAYETSCDTVAGKLTFKNTAIFIDTKDGYQLLWQDHLIFPDLSDTEEELDQAFLSELVVRPLEDGQYQYVSNHVIYSEYAIEPKWYMPRLSDEEWAECYGDKQ